MTKSFRDLKVWSQAMDLTTLIYAITSEFPKSEIYGLTSQMRRAAVSIPSNFAEESARSTRKDFKQFVILAKASNCELQTQLMIASRLNFGSQDRIHEAEILSGEVGRMLSGLAKYLANPTSTKN